MDALSIIAGCIAVVTAGGSVIRGLAKLQNLRNVPDILLAVIDEVSDLTLLVQEIRLVFQKYQGASDIPQTSISAVQQILDRAQAVLLELDQVVNYRLLRPPSTKGVIRHKLIAWICEERRVYQLQERLRSIRNDLTAGLITLNL